MSALELSQIDANLLVALDVLLATRGVSKAARRLHVSQPAMSQTLARLRATFDDPLLVRDGRQMVPTPYAERLAPALRHALAQLEAVIQDKPVFEPATARTRFTVATADSVAVTLLPDIVRAILAEAPGVDVSVRPYDARFPDLLEAGALDLVIAPLSGIEGSTLAQQPLFDERFLTLARADHPLFEAPLTPARWVHWPHGLVSTRGEAGSVVSEALAIHGLERRVAVEVPYFLAAAPMMLSTDLIFTLPRLVAHHLKARYPLVALEPPVEVPGFTLQMCWLARHTAEPAGRWLRSVVARIAAAI